MGAYVNGPLTTSAPGSPPIIVTLLSLHVYSRHYLSEAIQIATSVHDRPSIFLAKLKDR